MHSSLPRQLAGRLIRRLFNSLLILLGIAVLCLLGLHLAELGRAGLPVEPLATLRALGSSLYHYIFQHPATYLWKKESISAFSLVFDLFLKSTGLLLLSLLIATLVGGQLGVIAAQTRRRNLRPIVIFFSIIGVSLPSFLLAMVLWVIDFKLYPLLGLKSALLPPTGTGWDAHIVMPALVLAARPLAQIMQVTYIQLSEILQEDFVRVAVAKGISRRMLFNRHLLRNLLIPLLTTMGNSLRFSLASLPVVESFFLWEGIGAAILQALELGFPYLITDLVIALGILFLFINLVLEFLYPLIDPRIRSQREEEGQAEHAYARESLRDILSGVLADLRAHFRWLVERKSNLGIASQPVFGRLAAPRKLESETPYHSAGRQNLHAALTNLPLLLGGLLTLGLLLLALFGGSLAEANPYETHTFMTIDGQFGSPPFAPSDLFPWGTDAVGRDIQALVLHGARQTLTLALLATLARVAFGALLGIIAGWWHGSWFDRAIQSVAGIWAAFPDTIFAMLIILALGIQRGRSTFIVALCVVGWSSITQFTRSLVISHKPRLFVEAARSTGARSDQLLIRHILPFLISPLLVTLALEMGGILMLLAELGFLNIFLGGGYRAMIAESGRMVPVFYYFSDIPEWGALLANIRDWWRSYGWLAWYPGIFFFVSILTFNLFGEGLRRFFQEARLNLHRFVNRYTVLAGLVAAFAVNSVIQASTPIHTYAAQAGQFDTARALSDIAYLSSPNLQGREAGTPAGQQAAEFVAAQMEAIGLFPAGQGGAFIYNPEATYPTLTGLPTLRISDPAAGQPLTYRRDFREYPFLPTRFGCASGPVIGMVLGDGTEQYTLSRGRELDYLLQDVIIVIRASDLDKYIADNLPGVLIVDDQHPIDGQSGLLPRPEMLLRRYNLNLQISPQVADQLLAPAGASLADLDRLAANTPPNQAAITPLGATVDFCVPGEEPIRSGPLVVGVLPGSGSAMGLDSQAILVTAHLDGLGVGPDGTFYPGANDNASGVAAMLEIARVLKNGPYPPEKTVVFVAWSPGERGVGFSVVNVMDALPGLSPLTAETVIELTGVGAGEGKSIYLAEGTSFRLTRLFQKAAAEVDASVTNRGQETHAGLIKVQGFGERRATSAFVSWDGSNASAHTPGDVYELIDPEKIRQTGQTVTLVITVLTREANY